MAAGYDGSIRIKALLNHDSFDRGIRSMSGSINILKSTLTKLAGIVGAAFGVAAIVKFGKEAVDAASELSNAWMGLQSIVEGQGRSFTKAKAFIEDYISDGLVPLTDAVTAYKSLAARGYSDDQVQKTMTALKDAAAFGRQSTYSLGEAVATAAEGLKNENSILVDNAGVTKNVAKMWDEYAASIGTTRDKLTQEQKIQAEVNGILEETKFQTGDAAKLVNTYSGQVAMLGFNFQQLKVQVGNAIMPVVQAVLPGINAIISALLKLAKVFAQVTALLFGKSSAGASSQGSVQDKIASSGLAAADATDELASSTEGAGDAAKKAAKDMKGVLAGFDELNILADNASSSLSGAAGGLDLSDTDVEIPEVDIEGDLFEDVQISPRLVEEVEAFKDAIGRIWEVFQQSWEENGPSVIEAGKRALLSLYELAKSIGRAFTEAFTGGAGKAFLDTVLTIAATVLNIISDIADAWKTAFDHVGTEFFESILFRFTSMLNLINSIGEAFREVWNNGTGVEICETILQILTNINNIFGTIYTKIQEAWEANSNGIAIWQAVLDIVQTLLSFIERLSEATLKWAQGLNLEPLISAFRGLLEAINPFVEVITDGLSWAYENVLLPVSKWLLEDISPVAIEALTAVVETLTTALIVLEPYASWLWNTIIQPTAEIAGNIVVAILEAITSALTGLSNWCLEHQSTIEAIIDVIASFAAAWTAVNLPSIITTISVALGTVVGAIGSFISSTGIASAAAGALSAAIAFLASPIGIVVAAVGAVIATIVLLIKHWDQVKEAAANAWEYIKEKWNAAGEWFEKSVIEPVENFFSELWESVKNLASSAYTAVTGAFQSLASWFSEHVISPIVKFFSDGWSSISSAASAAWQAISTGVQKFWTNFKSWWRSNVAKYFTVEYWKNLGSSIVKGLLDGLKNIFSGLKTWASDVWSSITGVFSQSNAKASISKSKSTAAGGSRQSFVEYASYSSRSLPKLAGGAVIPPNQQFAAILGDQRSGKNLEAPADLIRQMVTEGIQAAMSAGGSGNGQPIQVNVMLDKKVLARAMVTEVNDMTRSAGKPVLLI